jgi:hypothetical protein
MDNKWHKAEWALRNTDQRAGSMSVFVHYDLLCWTFGIRGEVDWCWYDVVIELGPVRASFLYWRAAPEPIT